MKTKFGLPKLYMKDELRKGKMNTWNGQEMHRSELSCGFGGSRWMYYIGLQGVSLEIS
jgi:hypothetical protein